jgi:hypothetical protein
MNSNLVWDVVKSIDRNSPLVNLAHEGDKVAFFHYGSNS